MVEEPVCAGAGGFRRGGAFLELPTVPHAGGAEAPRLGSPSRSRASYVLCVFGGPRPSSALAHRLGRRDTQLSRPAATVPSGMGKRSRSMSKSGLRASRLRRSREDSPGVASVKRITVLAPTAPDVESRAQAEINELGRQRARALLGWLNDQEAAQLLLGRNPTPKDDLRNIQTK